MFVYNKKTLFALAIFFAFTLSSCQVDNRIRGHIGRQIAPADLHTIVNKSSSFASGGVAAKFSPDGQKVVYYQSKNSGAGSGGLYSADIDGSNALKLNKTQMIGLGIQSSNYKISPDSQRVVYLTNIRDSVYELYSVNIDATNLVKLNPTLPPGGTVSNNFDFSSDSQKVIYIADQDTAGVDELYSINTNGTSRLKLNATIVSGGSLGSVKICQDNSKIVYHADQDTAGISELYSVDTDGSNNVKLNGALVSGETYYMVFRSLLTVKK